MVSLVDDVSDISGIWIVATAAIARESKQSKPQYSPVTDSRFKKLVIPCRTFVGQSATEQCGRTRAPRAATNAVLG